MAHDAAEELYEKLKRIAAKHFILDGRLKPDGYVLSDAAALLRNLSDQEEKLLSERHDILLQLTATQEREGRLREALRKIISQEKAVSGATDKGPSASQRIAEAAFTEE